jgi:hypothetical protein
VEGGGSKLAPQRAQITADNSSTYLRTSAAKLPAQQPWCRVNKPTINFSLANPGVTASANEKTASSQRRPADPAAIPPSNHRTICGD